jgi:hypothetical protein
LHNKSVEENISESGNKGGSFYRFHRHRRGTIFFSKCFFELILKKFFFVRVQLHQRNCQVALFAGTLFFSTGIIATFPRTYFGYSECAQHNDFWESM